MQPARRQAWKRRPASGNYPFEAPSLLFVWEKSDRRAKIKSNPNLVNQDCGIGSEVTASIPDSLKDGHHSMDLKEAREVLGLGATATRQEIREAFRRAARRWHPDRAPAGAEPEYRDRMQTINQAYGEIKKFLEHYRYRLEEAESAQEDENWWYDRFGVGVWGPPPKTPTTPEK
jgi:molecular chaperone DnaJ